jgi:REP element-mobilizing transposase RayT
MSAKKHHIRLFRRVDKLRIGRRSVPQRCYFVTKTIYSRRNPIIHDARYPTQDSDTCGILVDALRWLHKNDRIKCHGYVIMRDHIHIQFTLGRAQSLSQVVRSYTTWTARNINEVREASGWFWARDFHDSWIRNDRSFWAHLNYIRQNPVKAGYVARPEDWPYS